MDRGYGSVKCGDRGALLVHRVAWELVRGSIPDGLDVLHSCDVRLCAKPDHLFLGTHLDNMRDMISKGRDVHFSGEQNGNSKLSIEDVDDIRCLLLKGVTGIELARRFGVSAGNISHIKTGRIWS